MGSLRGVILQAFEWYLPNDGKHWDTLASRSNEFASNGITALWIPPPYKGAGGINSVGYDVYDLHDLGEFKAKGNDTRTKYGTREQLKNCVSTLRSQNIEVYVDVVLNHRDGGEETQNVRATPYYNDNRKLAKGPLSEIRAYTVFRYPARAGKYSKYEWNVGSFDSVDYNANEPDVRDTVWLLEGKKFDDSVSLERGNYDHLLGCDVDFNATYVRRELTDWGKWIVEPDTLGGAQGMRLDALKHIPTWFWPDFLKEVSAHAGGNFFVVGEYVRYDLDGLLRYLKATEDVMSLFDFALMDKFYNYSNNGEGSDMRKLLDQTLVKTRPGKAVTFVTNHDTVPSQCLEKPIQEWFKPLAYAIILLRDEGYPCIFLADLDGSQYTSYKGLAVTMRGFKDEIYAMCRARRDASYGTRRDYFDHFNIVGWTFDGRTGSEKANKAMGVIMSAGSGGNKVMNVGSSGISFKDVLGNTQDTVTSDDDGNATFSCNGGSVSVYVEV